MAIKDNVQGVVLALFGASAGGHLTSLTGTANANGLTALAGDLAGSAGFILGKDLTTADAFRDNMLTGLGIPSTNAAYADAKAWADTELAKTDANRGEIVATAVTYLAGLTDASSPFFAAASAFNAKVASALAWSEGAGATVFGVAALQAQQGTAPAATGLTFTLLPAEDDIKGTAGDDTILATSAALSTLDTVDGGAGNDTFTISATSTTNAAAEVKNVENVIFNTKTFTEATLDAANIDGATITVQKGGVGYATTAKVDNAGDNVIVAGAGLTELTIEENDEAAIHVGAVPAIKLDVSAAANDLVFVVTATSKVAVTDLAGSTGSQATKISVSGGVGSVDVSGAASLAAATSLADVELLDGAKLVLSAADIATGFAATGSGIVEFKAGGATTKTIDLEDSDNTVTFSIGDIANTTLSLTNADGKTFVMNSANATTEVTKIDTTDANDGTATFTVNVAKPGSNLAIGTNADHVEINLLAPGSFSALTIAQDVTINIGANAFIADTTLNLTETAATDVVHLKGSGAVTLSSPKITNIDGSGLTGVVTLAINSASPTNAEYSLGSGGDVFTPVANATNGVSVDFGAGNDTAVLTATTSGGNFFLNGGAGDDKFVMGNSTTSVHTRATNAGVMAIDGGEGIDTLSVAISTSTAMTAAGKELDFDNIETFTVAGATLELLSRVVSGDTMTIKGSTTNATDGLKLTSETTDKAINLAKVTVDSSLDALTIEASAMHATAANEIIATGADETITFNMESAAGVTVNAGAGDDTVIAESATLAKSASITLGAGEDIFDTTGANTVTTATKLFSIKDFVVGVDTLKTGVAIQGLVSDPVDVKAATTQSSSELNATATGGILTLAGADVGNVDTLQEWINVAQIVVGANNKTIGFVFGGNTYVVEVTSATASSNVIELVGVTGAALGAAGAANILCSI